VSLSHHTLFRLAGADILGPVLHAVGRGLLSLFTLHRFADPQLEVMGHDPAVVRDHLAYLRRHRYRLLSLSDVLKLLDDAGGGPMPPAVAFTVDDGYADFARIGAPIFAEYDCPVTAFVPTGFLDRQLWLWWDRVAYLFTETGRSSVVFGLGSEDRAYRWSTPAERARIQDDVLRHLELLDAPEREATIASLSQQLDVSLPASPPEAFAPMTWDDVRRAANLGVTFAPHTVTHRLLTRASDEDCNWEIQESYRRLLAETDASVPVFCYPGGQAGPRELEAAQCAGFKSAVTTTPGYVTAHGAQVGGPLGLFALPRFPYPTDRSHLVGVVSGLARLRSAFRTVSPASVAGKQQ